MKKTLLLSASVICGALLSGCTSTVTSDGASQIPEVDTCYPGYHAKFDLKQQRVEGKSQLHVLLGIFAWGDNGFAENSDLSGWSFMPSPENYAKSAAVYSACQANQADRLVGTRYWVTTTDYLLYQKVECKVHGFPATMTGVVEKHPYAAGKKIIWCAEKPIPLQ